MKKAFTLVEILITVSILGILAAIVLPQFRSHAQAARESAAKDNLRVLRTAIERYAAMHSDVPPGYHNNDQTQKPSNYDFWGQMVRDGDYLTAKPENPFSGNYGLTIVEDDETFPTEADADLRDWIYQPVTKTIKLNWPGMDSAGVAYFDY